MPNAPCSEDLFLNTLNEYNLLRIPRSSQILFAGLNLVDSKSVRDYLCSENQALWRLRGSITFMHHGFPCCNFSPPKPQPQMMPALPTSEETEIVSTQISFLNILYIIYIMLDITYCYLLSQSLCLRVHL